MTPALRREMVDRAVVFLRQASDLADRGLYADAMSAATRGLELTEEANRRVMAQAR